MTADRRARVCRQPHLDVVAGSGTRTDLAAPRNRRPSAAAPRCLEKNRRTGCATSAMHGSTFERRSPSGTRRRAGSRVGARVSWLAALAAAQFSRWSPRDVVGRFTAPPRTADDLARLTMTLRRREHRRGLGWHHRWRIADGRTMIVAGTARTASACTTPSARSSRGDRWPVRTRVEPFFSWDGLGRVRGRRMVKRVPAAGALPSTSHVGLRQVRVGEYVL